MKEEYYSSKEILKRGCQYNVIFGERSNGKTYDWKVTQAIKRYFEDGTQSAYIRRWKDDFIGKRGDSLFSDCVANGVISEYSKNQWDNVYYQSSRWYFCRWDDDLQKRVIDDKPFCFGFALTTQEHDKSTSYPDVRTICFDEFLTRETYIADEFVLLMNVLSTIIRRRNDVVIFMLGNSVNQYCPYFNEMGLNNIKNMKQGDIDVYEYGDSGLKVAVEFCGTNKKSKKKSDIYFAFDNPKLQMITSGVWEMAMYPHKPIDFDYRNIKKYFFINFDGEMLQGEVVYINRNCFVYVHRKTTPIKNIDKDLIFSTEYNERKNWIRKITKPNNPIAKLLMKLYTNDKWFYQDNSVGEIIRNYINWCLTESIK